MLSQQEQKFYNRHILLDMIGEKGQQALKKSSVLVIGAGGLGCPVLSYLTGAGVGHIGIVDGDKVHTVNLHRQILYGHKHVGCLKTDAAISQLSDINPFIKFTGYSENLMVKNALDIIANYDIIVDATDNFPVRYLINDACIALNKPWVFASIDRFQGQLTVFNYMNGPSYRCLFPKPPLPETAPGCSQVGVLGVLPGILGTLQANEVIKMIIAAGDLLSGKMLMIDALKNIFYTIHIQRNEKSVKQILDLRSGIAESAYDSFCNDSPNDYPDITVADVRLKLKSKEHFQLIDVREQKNDDSIVGAIQIPLSAIEKNLYKIEKDIPLVVFCEKGVDSRKAVKKLKDQGLSDVFSLKGGLKAWKASYQR